MMVHEIKAASKSVVELNMDTNIDLLEVLF